MPTYQGQEFKKTCSPHSYPLINMAKFNDIQLLRTTFLRGPSVWTYRPVLEVWLDLGELEDYPSNKIPGLNERLTSWLPDLIEHTCGVGERGGFIQRLEGGTWMGHVMEHVIIELLNLAGMPAEFGQTREISRRGVYRMVFRCPEEAVARVALEYGHKLLMAAINDEAFDLSPPCMPSRRPSTTATWAPRPAASSMPPASAASPISA